jgi:hypothetical protein
VPGIIGALPVVLELERDRQLLELAQPADHLPHHNAGLGQQRIAARGRPNR